MPAFVGSAFSPEPPTAMSKELRQPVRPLCTTSSTRDVGQRGLAAELSDGGTRGRAAPTHRGWFVGPCAHRRETGPIRTSEPVRSSSWSGFFFFKQKTAYEI